jgi:cold shock CspA family protein
VSKRGSVRVLIKSRGYGCILEKDGGELYFDQNSLEPADSRAISVGDQVEYEKQYWGEHVRAVNVRPIVGRRIGGAHCS